MRSEGLAFCMVGTLQVKRYPCCSKALGEAFGYEGNDVAKVWGGQGKDSLCGKALC